MRVSVVRRLLELRRRAAGEAGLTLPELVVSMAILGTVLTGVVTVFAAGTRSHAELDVRFKAQVELTNAIGKLRREVHNACRIAGTPSFPTNTITLNMPATTPVQPPATPCTAPSTVTWCALPLGGQYALYRVGGATCTATGAKKYAEYLTSNQIYTGYNVMDPTISTLARLRVRFEVDARPADTRGAYVVTDEVVLRNSAA